MTAVVLIRERTLSFSGRYLSTSRVGFSTPAEGVMGPLHDPVTWYGINYTGTQITQWDFRNKGKSGWTGTSSFVLKVPLCNWRPSVIYSLPCDRIVQRAYYVWRSRVRLAYGWSAGNFNRPIRIQQAGKILVS